MPEIKIPDYLQSLFSEKQFQTDLKDHPLSKVFLPEGALLLLARTLSEGHHLFLVGKDEIAAEGMFEALQSFGVPECCFYPNIDVIPFTRVYASPDRLSDRVKALFALRDEKPKIVVTTLESYLRRLPPAENFDAESLKIKVGDLLDREDFARRLAHLGYIREYKAGEAGTFSIRGDIVDVFPPHCLHPVRISFFDVEVESLRSFHSVSQVSIDELEEFTLIPANEFACVSEELEMDREERELFESPALHSYFPQFFQRTETVKDYAVLPVFTIFPENFLLTAEDIFRDYQNYAPKGTGAGYLLSSVENAVDGNFLELTQTPHEENLKVNIGFPPDFGSNFSTFVNEMPDLLEKFDKIFLFVEYKELSKRLSHILKNHSPAEMKVGENLPDGKLFLVEGNIEHGFSVEGETESALILAESEISGKKRLFHRRLRQVESLFDDITDIQPGETVVHLNYGIGIFDGIERLNVLGTEKDYIKISYAEGEKLYVPLEQANLIGKYVGSGDSKPKLDSLGSKSWKKKRDRVQKSVEEFATRLIAIYAKRNAMQGHAFSPDTAYQKEFEDEFPYVETEGQITTIEEIKADMESPQPMDRLLCGDVGFGKTEVAMRAAFKAVMDGRQVAMLAPTTVLCEQHYISFQERFKGFPVKIAMVSRYTTSAKLTAIMKDLKEQKIDILIGTHKLFSEKLKFASLGLVIMDEEHKFGVEQKETLKERHPNVDFLSLSATPIPRTLHMSLATIRDISLLKTPPDMRIPVQTYVSDFNAEVIKHAVGRELERGGQVFFVHNRIKRLSEYAFFIEKLVPGAKVTIGHGQMHEDELEEAFLGFVKGHYNVFVSTTIIESGLDIPNANTIIISDAQRFGLSQLYQLKGRVGRSSREGHAYFLYPQDKALTETAQKRLFVISEYTDLGAGFQIAMKDLEIRGAGNILGKEQHGNIIAVGYDVYMRLLKEETEKLKGEVKRECDTLIDLQYNAFIPDSYIEDTGTRMEIYKKIVSVRNEDEIRALSLELKDRFGSLPASVSTLFEISRLKIKAGYLGIESIIEKGSYIELTFSEFSKADPMKAIALMQSGKHPIELMPHKKDTIFYKHFESNIQVKVKTLIAFLKDIEEG